MKVSVPLILLMAAGLTSGSRILLLPFHWISTVNQLAHIGRELESRGHEVHMLLLDKYIFIDKFTKSWPDINLITFTDKYPDTFAEDLDDPTASFMFEYFVNVQNQMIDLREDSEGFLSHCQNLLEDSVMEQKIRELKIDMVLLSGFPCYFVFPYKLGLPYIYVVSEREPWLARNPSLPSFVPVQTQMPVLTAKMTFWERLQNTKNLVSWVFYMHQVPIASDELVTKYAPNRPAISIDTLAGRSLLWLCDSDVTIDYPRPMMPNEVDIGGITVQPAKPLSPELEAFVTAAKKGLIVASFGSVSLLPEYIMLRIIDALKRLPVEYHIVMRWHLSTKKPDVPANILLLDYLPQNDLFAHPKTVLFVTHSGSNGQYEALAHAMPMVNLPVFYDQVYNAKRADYHGFSTSLSIKNFTAEELYAAMQEVLDNPSYKEKISRASAIFNSRPMSPCERAAFWVEHILQYGGDHLRSTALDLPAYQYLMLDIAAFLVALVVGGIFITCVLFKVSKKLIGM